MKIKKESKILKEFATFIKRGNMIDLAVGVIIGGAFTGVVNSLVNGIFTPVINFIIYLLSGKNTTNFSGLDIVLIPPTYDSSNNIVKQATMLNISSFITAVLNFVLTGIVLFLIIKVINRVKEEATKVKTKVNDKLLTKETVDENTINQENK